MRVHGAVVRPSLPAVNKDGPTLTGNRGAKRTSASLDAPRTWEIQPSYPAAACPAARLLEVGTAVKATVTKAA